MFRLKNVLSFLVLAKQRIFFVVGIVLSLLSIAPANAGSLLQPTISGGRLHTCATTEWGTAKCWGRNDVGQLGVGEDGPAESLVPLDVWISSIGTGIVQVAAGDEFSCGVTGTSGIACWGDNFYGELGTGDARSNPFPYPVFGLDSGMTLVTAGEKHACAITSAGAMKCWGLNNFGQLGNGTNANSFTPVGVEGLTSDVIEVSAGTSHTCAVLRHGELKCWGANSGGQLGDGTTTDRWVPTDVVGITGGVLSVSAGIFHTCAVTTSHGVKCWGYNGDGQLGNGRKVMREPPVDVTSLTSGVISVSTGWSHSCALLEDGGVRCWGKNSSGQLGDGSTSDSLVPVPVIDLPEEAIALTAGAEVTCAVTKHDLVKCWGFNIANGADHNTDEPIDVPANLGDSIFADDFSIR